MRVTSTVFSLVLVVACGKSDKSDKPADKPAAGEAADPTDEDPTVDKAAAKLANEAPTKPAKPADEVADEVAANASGAPTANADEPAAKTSPDEKTGTAGQGATCESALANAYRVVETTGSAALKEMAAANPREQSIAQCQRESWSADLRGCLAAATTTDTIYHDCYVRPLKDYPLTIKRTFDVSDIAAVRAADPKMFTLDGDYFQVAKGCGVLFVDTKTGGAGMFLSCDGKIRGPLTTPEELKEVFAMFSADLANAHGIVMSLVSKAATGRFGGSWKVCDSFGNCHRE